MIRIWKTTALSSALVLAACAAPTTTLIGATTRQMSTTSPTTKAPAEPNQLIVRAKAGKSLKGFAQTRGLKVLNSFTTDVEHILVQTGDVDALATTALSDPNVDVTCPNYTFQLTIPDATPGSQPKVALTGKHPNDPLFEQQWSMEKVHACEAWETTMGDPNLIVAVVDTGVDYNHPDLKGKIIKGLNNTGEGAKDDPIDGFGHGTHVAGIIGAIANNGVGVAGMAPNVRIIAEKVLSSKGGGNLFNIAAGVRHAVNAGAKIVNESLGGPAAQDPISAGVGAWATKKGVLLIAAAGNSNNAVGTPARYSDYYMAVAASDENDAKAPFSCFGPELSVASPGTKILNTTPTYKVPLNDHGYAQNYAALNGTSMATPLVAGLAALVWSAHPAWTWQQVRAQIEKTSVDLGKPGKDDLFGFGRVSAAAALK
jgi:thermitase